MDVDREMYAQATATLTGVKAEPRPNGLVDQGVEANGTLGNIERLISSLEHAIDPELTQDVASEAGLTGTSRPALCYAFNGINNRLCDINNRLHRLAIRVGADG